jgi:hypothetical protein
VTNEGFRFQGKPATVAGMVFDFGKRGNRIIFTLDDRSGRLEASMFEETYQQYRALIAKSAILIVEGSLRFDEFIEGWRLNAKRVIDIDQASQQHAAPADPGGDASTVARCSTNAIVPRRQMRSCDSVSTLQRADLVLSGGVAPDGRGSRLSQSSAAYESCRRSSRASQHLLPTSNRQPPTASLLLLALRPGHRSSDRDGAQCRVAMKTINAGTSSLQVASRRPGGGLLRATASERRRPPDEIAASL